MSGVNRVFLVGIISEKPELHEPRNDHAQLHFVLTTVEVYNKGINKLEHHEPHNIVMHNPLATAGYNILQKGDTIYIDGSIKTLSYYDADKIKRYETEIVCNSFSMVKKGTGVAESRGV